ncbi:MAG: hypothetical protein AABY51_05410 [Deltaproteobacteria bacterium]
MKDLFLFAIGAGVFFISGFSVMRLIDRRSELGLNLAAKAGTCFLAGLGLVSLQMFLYSLAGIGFGFLPIAMPWAALSAFLVYKGRKGVAVDLSVPAPAGLDRYSVPFFIIIAIQLLYSFIYAPVLPVSGWDSWAIWFLKAKVFFLEGSVSAGFLTDPSFGYSHPDYPLMVPLAVSWIYTVINGADDSIARLLYPLQYAALLAVFYHFVKTAAGARVGLLFTALLSLTPILVMHGAGLAVKVGGLYTGDYAGYADLALSAYFMGSGAFIYLYLRDGKPAQFLCAVLFLSIGAWTKNEGLTFAAIGLLILWIGSARTGKRAGYLIAASIAIFAIFVGPWAVYKAGIDIGSEYAGRAGQAASFDGISRLSIIFRYLARDLFLFTGLFSFTWWLWLCGVILNIRGQFKRPVLSLNVLALSQMSVYIFVYMITPANLEWHLQTSLDRLSLQLLPLFLMISALNFSALFGWGAGSVNRVGSKR